MLVKNPDRNKKIYKKSADYWAQVSAYLNIGLKQFQKEGLTCF